ncbi:MAG: biotin/lipoyl-binding protein, partial [Anaerolineaceae bacterium]|nr:biotin/lipoyl-binding protein [Anaerolineaceae bacterium]
MSIPITLSVAGILLNWLVEEGAAVQSGDIIAEIEADKATVEIEAPVHGILLSLSAEPGDELAEGATIAAIAAVGEEAVAADREAEEADELGPDAAAESEDAITAAAAESKEPDTMQTERLR